MEKPGKKLKKFFIITGITGMVYAGLKYLLPLVVPLLLGYTLLHVLRGTDLAADYAAGGFEVLTLEHYIDLLEQCLRVLPPEVVIHRLTGDGAKCDLIAPLWSADKKRVLNTIHAAFARDDLVQGSELKDQT